MGRKNKTYQKDLKQQIYDKLLGMLRAGEGTSKKDAIADGTDRDKIHSYNTYDTYRKHCGYFAAYIQINHPDCTTIKSAKKYVPEWLQYRVDHGNQKGEPLSAWTITLEREALGKLYGITPDDPGFFKTPKRRREDIKRSRVPAARDRHFSKTNNDEFIRFCKGTGCRRNIIAKLEGRDLITAAEIRAEIEKLSALPTPTDAEIMHLHVLQDAVGNFPNQDYYIHHRTDKGGRERYAPIIGDDVDQIVARMRATAPHDKVWQHVPTNADIHSYRADYATKIYKMHARPIEDIPYDKINKGSRKRYQSDVYACRKDEAGKKLDKQAMGKCTKALGHNRLEIVANNYIRGL